LSTSSGGQTPIATIASKYLRLTAFSRADSGFGRHGKAPVNAYRCGVIRKDSRGFSGESSAGLSPFSAAAE
jgi:hypothetical protein